MTSRNEDDDPTLGAKPMFSRFYLRQMEAEQLYESLLVATAADSTLSQGRARRDEGPVAAAVQHGLRHRRERRSRRRSTARSRRR